MGCVKQFCCCCSLRTGGVILGWIGLVSSAFNITSVAVILANLDSIVPKYDNNLYGALNTVFEETIRADETILREHGYSVQYRVLSIALPTVLTSCVIGLLAHVLLLLGATRGNRFLLLPWLILTMTVLVTWTLGLLIVSCIVGVQGLIALLLGLPILGLILYWWLCVLSLFHELRDQTQADGMVLVPPPATRTLTSFASDSSPPPYAKLNEDV